MFAACTFSSSTETPRLISTVSGVPVTSPVPVTVIPVTPEPVPFTLTTGVPALPPLSVAAQAVRTMAARAASARLERRI